MHKIIVSRQVQDKISDLETYMRNELKLSKKAARRRSDRMRQFVLFLANNADYPFCRFKKWCVLGFRCAVFEKDWVFAYQIYDEGIIIQDMSHTSLLNE